MKKWLRILAALAVLGLVVVAVSALAIDKFMTREVLFITPKSADVVEMEKALWMEGDPVADIYGVPAEQTAVVVMPDESKIFVPEEDRSLLLMSVDKQQGENPLQVKTIWFLTKWAAIGLAVAAGLFLGLSFLGSSGRSD
jgi:hypothetical protein